VLTGTLALPAATGSASTKLVTCSYQESTEGVAPSEAVVPRSPPGAPGAAAGTRDKVHDTSDDNRSDDKMSENEAGSETTKMSGSGPARSTDVGCLAHTICEVKDRIRWQTSAWSPATCQKVALAVRDASRKYDLSMPLLLAVMINESDLNEKAARVYMKEGKVYAKDGGLMGLRCVLDRQDRCINSNLRGVRWRDLMEPSNNIALGARELAGWRDGGAYVRKTVKVRDRSGHLRPVLRNVPCLHTDHGFWAHYNHGPRYIDHGYPRHYPHRVAVLDHALAAVLNVEAPELRKARITVRDPGKPQRTADHPMEARYKKLCSQIQSVHACSSVAMN
jgi:hypothetical protein